MIKQLEMSAVFLFLLPGSLLVYSQENSHVETKDMIAAIVANTRFIQIPGPNPILREGEPGNWDEKYVEMAEIIKFNDTYYLY